MHFPVAAACLNWGGGGELGDAPCATWVRRKPRPKLVRQRETAGVRGPKVLDIHLSDCDIAECLLLI